MWITGISNHTPLTWNLDKLFVYFFLAVNYSHFNQPHCKKISSSGTDEATTPSKYR